MGKYSKIRLYFIKNTCSALNKHYNDRFDDKTMLLNTNPETNAMAVMVIEKAASIPESVWLFTNSVILL